MEEQINKEEQLNRKEWWRRILTGLVAAVLAVSIGRLFWISMQYKESGELYEQTNEQYVTESDAESAPLEWYQMISVDLENLQAENPEVAGWIYFENEPSISYPVMHSDSNKKYLKTAWQGDEAVGGAIFMERSNQKDFSDPHTIIYGHNMRNLSMFGKLRYYKNDADYYPSHLFFQIITNTMYYRYWIVAYKDVAVSHKIYTVWMNGGQDFQRFIYEKILTDTPVSAGYDPRTDDHIITLSTCNSINNKRFTVSAVRIAQQVRTAG